VIKRSVNCDRCGVETAELGEGLCVACWDQRVEAGPVVALSVYGKPLSQTPAARYNRNQYALDPGKCIAKYRDYRMANKEKVSEWHREYYQRNKSRLNQQRRRRRARCRPGGYDTAKPADRADS
jgi:hypothetical protein